MDINIWVTQKCNMKCTYCYEGIDKENRSMNRKIADKVIEYINSLNEDISIRFHGGEPLLEFSLIKYFCSRLKDNKHIKRFGLTTNGLLLDDEKIDFLIRTMGDVSISLDGDEYVNDLHRKRSDGCGTYKLVIPAVKKMLEKEPYVRARMTITPDTVSHLDQSVDKLVEIGFRMIAVAVDSFDARWNEKNQNEYMDAVLKIYQKYKDMTEYSISVIDNSLLKKLGPCAGGKTSIHIATNGDLYPCGLTVNNLEFKIGNIETGIDSRKLEDLLSYSELKNPECEGCTMYSFCSGTRCKMINRIITGKFLCPPYAICMEQNIKAQVYKLQ